MEKLLQIIVQTVLDVPEEDDDEDGGDEGVELTRNLTTGNENHSPHRPTCFQGLSILAVETLARAHFYPSLLQSYLAKKLNIYPWYTRIDDHICLGALPTGDRFAERLVSRENVVGVISMNQDFELRRFSVQWEKHGVQFLRLPTRDIVDAPTQAKILQAIEFMEKLCSGSTELTEVEHNSETRYPNCVYVHCKAGRTRSATIVVCYLIKKYKWSPTRAMAHVKSKRPNVLLGPRQRKAIEKFYSRLHEAQLRLEDKNGGAGAGTDKLPLITVTELAD